MSGRFVLPLTLGIFHLFIGSLIAVFSAYRIEIAIYGKPYVKAARDTWNLFKDRGIDALVNDCLINNIWTFG